MKRKHLRRALIAAAVVPALNYTQFAHAAISDYFFNATSGGSGVWDTSTKDWSTSATTANNYTWTNNSNERANFNFSPGMVTVQSGGVTTAGINFNVDGYTLTGGAITVVNTASTGTILTTAAGVTGTISSNLTGGSGLSKQGTGTLIVNGTTSFTGGLALSAGTMLLNGTTSFTGAGNVTGGGILGINSASTFGGALNVTSSNVIGNATGTFTNLNVTNGTATFNAANKYGGSTFSNSFVVGTAQASGSPFGTGSITINTSLLRLNGIAANTTTTIGNLNVGVAASGTATPNATGAANLIVDNSAGSGGGFSTTFAAASLNRNGPGGVLVITPVTGSLGSGEKVTFTNGSSVLTNGIVPWVATQTSGSNPALDFATYGSNGIVAASYSSTNLAGSANTDTVNQTSSPTITADVTAYSLKTNQAIDLGGHNLTLGNGAGPTGLILNDGGQITNGNISYGSTEGLIYYQGTSTIGSSGNALSANGLTVTASGASNLTVNSNVNLNGDLVSSGNGLLFAGPINVINASGTSRAITTSIGLSPSTVNLGSPGSPSVLNLGNPVANGGDGAGKSAYFFPAPGTTIAVNDVIQDPSVGGLGSVQFGGGGSLSATVQLNAMNTYTGGTVFQTGGIVQFKNDSNASGTTGPFGSGALLMNNTSNDVIQPVGGGTRIIANPITMNFGFTVGNAASDTTGVTFTGPIAMQGAGRTVTNNFNSGAILTLGSASSPSTWTLPTANAQTTVLNASGETVINDVIKDSSAGSGTLQVISNGTLTLAAQNTYADLTYLNGAGTVIKIPVSSNALPGPSFTSGPFGTGQIVSNNGTNTHFRPIGGNQVISNPFLMTFGLAMDNASGDSSSLTFAGAITMGSTGRTISNGFAGSAGGMLTIGSASAPSTWTLSTSIGAAQVAALAGPIVINDVIQNAAGFADSINLNPNAADVNTITLSGANTYSGTTAIGGSVAGFGSILINVSSVGNPGSITSGPFGTGPINPTSSGAPGLLVPIGADRTVANAIPITSSGFWVANSSIGTPLNLNLTGPITLGTANRTITNNMVPNSALTFGSAASPSTMILSHGLIFQTQNSTSGSGVTVINDIISDGAPNTGSLTVQSNAIVRLNATNTYTGGNVVQSGGSLTTATNLSNGTLSVITGGVAKVLAQSTPGATAGVTLVPALSVDSASKLDITNNGLIVQSNTTFSSVQTSIISAMSSNYTGFGITSSNAAAVAADSSNIHKTAVGYATAAELGTPATFLGVPVTDGGSTLARYTLDGDTNLTGSVNSDDFANLAANFGSSSGVDWFKGDFNGDGIVNALDFNALATNYGQTVSASMIPDDAAAAPMASLGTLVPEPAIGALLIAPLLIGRRRRRMGFATK